MIHVRVSGILFFLCSLMSVLTAQTDVTMSGRSARDTVFNGVRFSSLDKVTEKNGYTISRDVEKRSVVCKSKNLTVTFFENNRFAVINDSSVTQLIAAPVMVRGVLYISDDAVSLISLPPALPVAASVNADTTAAKSSAAADATVPANKKGIRSINCSVKQNGTLFMVELSDSLPFDYMYYHPNLILNFYGGVVDTAKIKLQNRTGIVKSVSSVQFKESAQVSLVLSSWVEDPVFDYVQDTKTVMVALRPAKKAAVQSKAPEIKTPRKKGTVVVIDPGHGGKDPGAIGHNGIKEKDVVFAISLQVRDILKSIPGITPILTREKDIFIPLSERTEFANKQKADLFVSIHSDAVPGDSKRKNSTKGYKIYFLSQAKNEEDKLVAMRENAVIELEEKPQNYSNLQNVLIDIAGNEFLRESQDLCILLDLKFASMLKKKIEKLHLGVGQANFWVLNGAYMPSVLIETGFLSNPQEAKLLADKEFQKTVASAISEAIVHFTKQYGARQ